MHPHPYPYAPAPVRRWWQHPALIIVLLVVFPPAGIALAWLSLWKQSQKIVATVLSGLWFLLPFLVPSADETKDDAKAAPKPTVTATATASVKPTPTPTPSKTTAAPVMPRLVGGTFAAAEQLITDNQGRVYAAYKDVDLPAGHGTWTVCFQRPDAGAPIASMVPVVYLTGPGVPCPKSPNTLLHTPTPTPAPTTQRPTPTPEPTRTSAPEPTQDADEDTSSGGDSSVYYRNCTAVRAAGAAPIRAGEPGYGSHLDRDGDGVACEG
ncbi:excalibur calcium-binding domain-containing protein [Streptomyces exfoliatus]|uniref:excalibur calcium-binding domain-containing protein n=1 Tax=Streptomyces exfoliatus TaxID=1905 RepID=UPI003C2D49E0